MANDPSDISAHSIESRPKRVVTLSLTPKVVYIVLLVLVCGVSFWAGMHYQKHHTGASASRASAVNGAGGRAFGGFGARRAGGVGTVTAVSDTSITVQNVRTGSTNTYSIDSSTVITDNGSTVSASDIKTGDRVLVRTSSSSSTTATQIDVNPEFGGGAATNSDPSTTTN